MPLDPHTWNGDFVTASLLDNDLYLYQGKEFTPNGIRFHANRPVYKGYNANSGNSLASSTWGLTFGNSSNAAPASTVVADTPGQWGAWFDFNTTGNIRLDALAAGSGLNAAAGGLMLAMSYCLWPTNAGTGNVGCGIGDSSTGTTAPESRGTHQALNSAHQVCTMDIDLLDANTVRYAPFAFNGSGGALAPVNTANADGTGSASRHMAFWASVYPANGNVVSFLPAPNTPWSPSSFLSSSMLNGNTGLKGPLRFLNMPPLLRAEQTAAQNLTGGVDTQITSMTATSGFANYSSFASNTYTCPFNGLYFVHGLVGINNITGRLKAGVAINGGTTYWGPWCTSAASGVLGAAKTQVFSLNAGDTITLHAQSNVASTTSTGVIPRLVVLYVGEQGVPPIGGLPKPPDTSFRWTAGTTGPVDTLFNQHIANDLVFLLQRPYLLAYQTAAQTGIAMSTPTALNLDSVQGIVHADTGDNYSGWNSGTNTYTAKASGWYLAVSECFMAQPSLTATPSVLGALSISPSGTSTWDFYQKQNLTTSTADGGAASVGVYYLRAGDTIQAGLEVFDASATTTATDIGTGYNSHFELVWLGE